MGKNKGGDGGPKSTEVNIEKKIQQTYAKLDAATTRQQHKKVLSRANDILDLLPEDTLAKHCKLVALIHLGQVSEATKYSTSKDVPSLPLESAYCAYRNGQLSKALELIQKSKIQIVMLFHLTQMTLERSIVPWHRYLAEGKFGNQSKMT